MEVYAVRAGLCMFLGWIFNSLCDSDYVESRMHFGRHLPTFILEEMCIAIHVT